MAEDLTTYTEMDTNSRVTVTTTKAGMSFVSHKNSVYLYKNFGLNHFDKIDLSFSALIYSTSYDGAEYFVGFNNSVGADASVWQCDGITIVFFRSGTTYNIGLYTDTYDACAISADTDYYLTLTRAAGSDSITLRIYSDSARTNLLDTLTGSGLGTQKFKCFYPAANEYTGADNGHFSGYFENFVLNPPAMAGGAQIIGLSAW